MSAVRSDGLMKNMRHALHTDVFLPTVGQKLGRITSARAELYLLTSLLFSSILKRKIRSRK